MQENRTDIHRNDRILPDAGSVIRDIVKQWQIIVLIGISVALLAGIAGKLTYQPQYQATATFTIGKNGWSDSAVSENLSVADSLTESLKELAKSSLLEHRVCEALGADRISGTIEIDGIEASNLMTVTVTADSSRNAWEICNASLDVVSELAGSLMQDAAIRVIQKPQIPLHVSNPLRVRNIMEKGGGAGIMMALFLVVFYSYWKDTVKNSTDLADVTDTPLLGIVCRERKYKTLRSWVKQMPCSLRIDYPGLSFSYVEAFRMLAGQIRRRTAHTGDQIFLVTSVSENEGKSTVAANLALALLQDGCSVLLMDLDFAKPTQHQIFHLEQEAYERFDLIGTLHRQEALRMKRMGSKGELPVVCNTSPGRQVLDRRTLLYLREVLAELRKEYDYILLDASPLSLVAETEALTELADRSILVIREDWTPTADIREAAQLLETVRGKLLGCVLNQDRGETLAGSSYGYGYGKYGKYGIYGMYGKYRYGHYGYGKEPRQEGGGLK